MINCIIVDYCIPPAPRPMPLPFLPSFDLSADPAEQQPTTRKYQEEEEEEEKNNHTQKTNNKN